MTSVSGAACYSRGMETNNIGGLIAFLLGWLLSQCGKMIVDVVKMKRWPKGRELLNIMMRSGGMPSGHAATFVALATFLGLRNGFTSGIFVLAAATASIVIYDAVNVRYAVGEQGKLLNIMVEGEKKRGVRKTRVVEGHTVPQVCAGAILGILLGIICNVLF